MCSGVVEQGVCSVAGPSSHVCRAQCLLCTATHILLLLLKMFLVNLHVWLVIISVFKYMIIFVALVASVVFDWMDVLEPLPHFHFYNFLQGLGSVAVAAIAEQHLTSTWFAQGGRLLPAGTFFWL